MAPRIQFAHFLIFLFLSRKRERMAELIGVIASLMTLTEAVSRAAPLVVDFHMAPKQIEEFEVQISPVKSFI